MAYGKVVTGFSKPYVANYANNEGVVSYSNPTRLARGVEVSIEPEVSDASNFYADNIVAETVGGVFTGGTLTLTVDGLKQAAEKLIQGLPTAGADGFMAYNNQQSAPYLGAGLIVRSMSGGSTYYTPIVLAKVQFDPVKNGAKTQEDNIDFQTQELTATIMRDDTSVQNWKFVGSDYESESDAETALVTKLGGPVVS